MRRLIVVLILVSAALAGGGLYIASGFEGPPEDTTAPLVPAEATAYVSFFVSPSSDQKALLRDRVEEGGDDLDAVSLVENVLDRVTSAFGLPYADVAPWVDRQMAAFVMSNGEGAVVVEVADRDAARAAIEGANGRMLGDHAVFGDARAVRAVVSVVEGEAASIADEGVLYPEAVQDVPEDRLAFAVVTGGELSSRAIDLPPSLDPVELALGVGQGNAVSLRADENGLVFDGFSYSDGAILLLAGTDPPLRDLGNAGRGAWAAAIVPNLSAAVDALNRELRQVHRVGTAPLGRLPLPDAVERTDQALIWLGGDVRAPTGGLDVTIYGNAEQARFARALADLPIQPTFEFRRDRLRARFGSGEGKLASDERYAEAAGWLGRLDPIGYLDVREGPFGLVLPLAGVPFPSWLGDVDRIAVGLDAEANPTHWRVVVSLKR